MSSVCLLYTSPSPRDRQKRLLKIIRNGENYLNQINQKDRMGQRNNQKQVRP